MLAVSAFESGNIAATLLILRATDLLEPGRGLDSATKIALVLYAGYNLAATLVSIPAGHLGDRRGMTRVLAAGVLLFGVAYLLLAATGPSIAVILTGFVLAGVRSAASRRPSPPPWRPVPSGLLTAAAFPPQDEGMPGRCRARPAVASR